MRRYARALVAILFCLAAALPAWPAFAQTPLDELLQKAAALTSAGRHAEAYALLSAEEDTYIGEIPFDYALGRAALHAGRPDRATIAFSRVLALDPGHAGARIDSGRAYLALGNRAQAEVAFRELLALDPPPALRTQLLLYLAEARAEQQMVVTTQSYLDVYAGVSSNVNQAPSQGQVFVPGFGVPLQLADKNVRKGDSFLGIGGGTELAMPLGGGYSFSAAVDFQLRENRHESDFDVGGIGGSLGISYLREGMLARARVQSARNTLGGETSRKVDAVGFDVSEPIIKPGAFGAWFGFGGFGTYRHPSVDLKVFDADFISYGGGVNTRIDEKSTVAVVLLAGEDKDNGGNPAGDRSGLGFRAAYERVLGTDVRLSVVGGALRSDYSLVDPSFLTKREDLRWDLELTLRYKLSERVEARVGLLRSVQESNIAIYDYRRTDATLGLRYQFD